MLRFAAALALCAVSAQADDGFARLEGHGGPVKGVAVSADGQHALTASFDYSVGYWELASGEVLRWLDGHEAAVNAVSFSADGRTAYSAGDDFSLIVWDLESGALRGRHQGHKGKILDIAVSNDPLRVATSGWDGWKRYGSRGAPV